MTELAEISMREARILEKRLAMEADSYFTDAGGVRLPAIGVSMHGGYATRSLKHSHSRSEGCCACFFGERSRMCMGSKIS